MKHNYWHIQLQPDNKLNIDTIRNILTTKQVIGMGESWNDKTGKPVNDPKSFKDDMKIGYIVMVRNGSTPVALVKVTGDAYIEPDTDDDFDWFRLRRKIEIISNYGRDEKKLLDQILKENDKEHIQAPGTLTFCNGSNATNDFIIKWYKLSKYKRLMENIKLSTERQTQIKELWDKFKNQTKDDEKRSINQKLDDLITQWEKYRNKIANDTFTLDDYTNRLENPEAKMPGGYLCNFLERTTSELLGSSKPGNAENFGVKLNNDNETYYVKNKEKEKEKEKEKAKKHEAKDYFEKNIKGLLKDIVSAEGNTSKIIGLIENAEYSAKQILMKLAVLDNLSDFIYIYSGQVLDDLYNDFIDGEAEADFEKSHQICTVVKQVLDINEEKSELVLLSRFLWDYANLKAIADVNSPNVILYGPPGTGKTYSVIKNLDFVCQGDTSRYEVLQFHPSFTYEDFIEGIKPKGVSKDGNIRFELVNGVFKNFCIKAKNNAEKDFYFVVDEINRANLSTVFGETLSLLEKDYRHDVKTNSKKNLIRTQYSMLIEDLIKEDKEKYKHLAYEIDNNEVKFGVPKNVFFIGMMNDVDKSIDAFDLALRRRFKWIRKDCDYEVIKYETKWIGKNSEDDFINIDNYVESCIKLNQFISGVDEKHKNISSENLGLGKSYEFGHSFFMKISDIAKQKKISVPVNHNFYEEAPIQESSLGKDFNVKKSGVRKLKQIFSSVYELKLGAEQLKQVEVLNFKRKRFFEPDEERLILKLYSKEKEEKEKEYFIQTGLYAGVIFHKNCRFNITARYGNTFLKRMLNFVNDIYVDNEEIKAKKDKTENQFLFIIAHLFIQSLEKASVLGLPQQYQKHSERSHKVRGSIDFNSYLKRDIPFQGKLTTSFREQKYVQEIIDVLYLALRTLESIYGKEIQNRLLGLKQLLKQQYSGHFVNYEIIQKSKTHPTLNNPMYNGFKKILEYAEIILLNKDLIPDNVKQNLTTTGYLFDIAELYEVYLEKLLSRNFPEWIVNGQAEMPIYKAQFYNRIFYPDIVMRHEESDMIIVFDAKFKKMKMQNNDVDRADLHQIHSYSGFYQNKLIASGLIYPLSEQLDIEKSYSDTLYGNDNNDVRFIVDGIYVKESHSMKELIESENEFINRVSDLTDGQITIH